MNIIYEACKMYDGRYLEDGEEVDLNIQPSESLKTITGYLKYKKEIMSVSVSRFGGPYVIRLKCNDVEFSVFKICRVFFFEKSYLNFMTAIFGKPSRLINSKYQLIGDDRLLKRIKAHELFVTNLNNEDLLYEGADENKSIIQLKPFKGIYSLETLNKYLESLCQLKSLLIQKC